MTRLNFAEKHVDFGESWKIAILSDEKSGFWMFLKISNTTGMIYGQKQTLASVETLEVEYHRFGVVLFISKNLI